MYVALVTDVEGLFVTCTRNDDLRFYNFRTTLVLSLREEFQILTFNGLVTLHFSDHWFHIK